MQSEVPKQFLLLDDRPIIVRTIQVFNAYDANLKIIVVLPKDHIDQWIDIKSNYLSDIDVDVAEGGSTRGESVQSGLAKIDGPGLVAVHDAVRPFVSIDVISQTYHSAERNGSGVAVVQLKDSIRELDGESSLAKDRANYVLVQTPQTFDVERLKIAYAKAGSDVFTDDASVYESAGYQVYLVDGDYANIKITTPEDLK